MEAALAGEADYDIEYPIAGTGRWVHSRGSLIRSRSGRALKLAGVVNDSTDRRKAFEALETSERRQKLLINELNHRVKNTLATIQSIATLTARRASSVEEFSALFEARLMALSETHNLLTAAGWEQATLRDLLAKELRPYSPDQFRIDGPDVLFEPPQALAMGMILHELATNASKYGGLSTPKGRVAITWTLCEQGSIDLTWRESGGPPVTAPSKPGFGSRLMTQLSRQMAARLTQTWEPSGLVANLAIPAPKG